MLRIVEENSYNKKSSKKKNDISCFLAWISVFLSIYVKITSKYANFGWDNMLSSLIGALFLTAKVTILFFVTIFEALASHGLNLILFVFMVLFIMLLLGSIKEIKRFLSKKNLPGKSSKIETKGVTDTRHSRWYINLINFLGLLIGAITTYGLNHEVGFGAVLAAGLVGIFGALFFPAYGAAIYCGAFIGMSSSEIFHGYVHVIVAALIAAIVYLTTKYVFTGFGGKLGTIALIGVAISVVLTEKEFLKVQRPGWDIAPLIIIFSVLGAVVTYILNVRLQRDPVMSSAAVGISAGLLLPQIYSEFGELFATIVICASFAGMSSKERIPNEFYMILAGIICAITFIYTFSYLGGAGGKLGTIAFGSVIVVSLLQRVWRRQL